MVAKISKKKEYWADFNTFASKTFLAMIELLKKLSWLCAVAFPLISCSDREKQDYSMHPFVERAAYDTSCVENRILSSYDSSNRDGSIAIVGEGLEAVRLAECFAVFDACDNIDASSGPDGIPDFAGEFFDVLMDYSNAPYRGYVEAGNELFLRELLIRNAVAMLDGACYANAYDKVRSERKHPAKALVVSSVSYSPEIMSDLDTLFSETGLEIPVMFPPLSSVRTVMNTFKSISGVGVMAGLDVAASGIYGELFRDLSYKAGYSVPVHNVIFSPEGETPEEKVRNFIKMYINSGYTEPLNAIIVDDMLLAGSIDSMYVALDKMMSEKSEEGALYESVVSDGFMFIDPARCVASELFRELRRENNMALRINYPKFEFFISVFSPDFLMQGGQDEVSDTLKYSRAYDAGANTVKIVRLSRRHVGKAERAVLDSLAPNIDFNF